MTTEAEDSLVPSADLFERFFRDNMTTWEHHWWICISSLFFADWTDEDGMEQIGWREWYLNLTTRCISKGAVHGILMIGLAGNSFTLVHCPPTSPMTLSSFSSTGRAMPPAVTAV